MAFVRFSLMTPKVGQQQHVRELIDRLLEFHRGREGFITAFRLDPDEHDPHSFTGRVSVWESEEHANATAMDDHDIALQSEIKRFVDDETHEERSFTAEMFDAKGS